jgi:hypothetical protein
VLSLSGASRYQAPGEADLVLCGDATLEWDAADTTIGGCTNNGVQSVLLSISIDGQSMLESSVGTATWFGTDPSLINQKVVPLYNHLSDPIPVFAFFFEPGQTTHHTVTATLTAGHPCAQGGQSSVSGLALDVVQMQ